MLHQLRSHFKKLIEKELKDPLKDQNRSHQEIADALLKDVNITELLQQRAKLIQTHAVPSSYRLFYSDTNTDYSENVLQPMIQKARARLHTYTARD